MVQNFVQSVSFQYIKEFFRLISPASVEIYFRDYERAMQDMKNRQNTENLEITTWVYRCEAEVLRLYTNN